MSVLTLNVDEVMRTLSAESSNPFVVHDKEVDIVRFAINSGFADIVLDGQVALRVMYQRPGETEVRAQTLTYYDTDGLHNYYDWQLSQSDLAKNGSLMVALCILDISGGEVSEWHTTPCAVRVLSTIHTDDSDEGDDTITPTVKERVAVLESMIQRVASGAPIVVASTSAMTDTDQIYVLKTDGKWYYHNGTTWTAGGEYGAVSTDTTLTQSGVPADAKATGDAIASVETNTSDLFSANMRTVKDDIGIISAVLNNTLDTNEALRGVAIAGGNRSTTTHNGITYTWDGETETYTINGTATNNSIKNLIGATSSYPPANIFERGKSYYIETECDNPEVTLSVYQKSSNTELYPTVDMLHSNRFIVHIPDSADTRYTGLLFRFFIKKGAVINNAVATFKVYEIPFSKYIFPTNDNADRAAEILQRLNAFSECVFTKGSYYISNVVMPSETSISGNGESTKLIMLSGASGDMIALGNKCTIKDVTLLGNAEPITLDGNIQTRNGVSWRGEGKYFGVIDRCRISDFSGAGVIAEDTNTPVDNNMAISNSFITRCNVGVYIKKLSEFLKICNNTIVRNYYGVLNRGGNNNISNCGIDANVVNVQIDNDEGSNNGHGVITGCSLNHADNNEGYGLIIRGTGRMLVSNCNFYYSKVLLSGTNGNIISNCGFGNNVSIEVNTGSANCNILSNCMFRDADVLHIQTGNVKLSNNWTRSGVEVLPTAMEG